MPKSASARAAATSNTGAKIMTSETGSAGDASGLSSTLQGHVDDIRTLLQCGICIRPLYEPFTLACGHTFCYSCLTSWFTGGRTNKTCPDCRAPVKSQPTPAYLVRAVVQMFTSRAELLEKGETTAEHTQHQQEEAERLENDKKNTHPKEGGLFRGTFNKKPPVAQPIVDLEDDVVRCPHCSWELEDDSGCAQCGYRQPPDSLAGSESGLSESDENSEMTDYFDDELDDGFAEIDEYAWQGLQGGIPPDHLPFGIPPQLYGLNRRNFHPPFPLPLANNPYEWQFGNQPSSAIGDSEDEEEEEDYDDGEMDSFIDDDEHVDGNDYDSESDRSTVVGDNEYHERDYYHEPQHYRFDASQLDSDVPMSQQGDGSDDSEDGVEDDEDHDDDDDDDDDEEPIRPAVNGPRRYNIQRFGLQSNPSGFRPTLHSRMINRSRTENPVQTPRSVGSSANNAISLDDDDDDDEDSDEGPVGPSRRGRDRRNCGRVAY